MVSKNDQIDYLEHHLDWAERKINELKEIIEQKNKEIEQLKCSNTFSKVDYLEKEYLVRTIKTLQTENKQLQKENKRLQTILDAVEKELLAMLEITESGN